MHIDLTILRERLHTVLTDKARQGHATEGWAERVDAAPASYDALYALAEQIADLPLRPDWPYVEPSDLAGIRAESDPARPTGVIDSPTLADSAARVRTAFLASVCGCQLGKPVEIWPSMYTLRDGMTPTGDWPIRDYISTRSLDIIGKRHPSWGQTCRENIRFAAPDDDINYTVMGMLALERGGLGYTLDHLRTLWLENLAPAHCFGPERTLIVQAGLHALKSWGGPPADYARWVNILNPSAERCGALIRADAYGYACPGRPELAAELAWRDASFTHRRTGIYGTMWVAAAIAAAQVMDDPLEVFETASRFVPRKSRFYEVVTDCLNIVADSSDWVAAYERMFARYKEYGHCMIYFECGTLINTLRFARSIDDGFCMQVMQGNDTDSFGATSGSILGCFFGPGHLDPRWLKPLNNTLFTTLANFHEQNLEKVAERMARLPALTLDPARWMAEQSLAAGKDPGA